MKTLHHYPFKLLSVLLLLACLPAAVQAQNGPPCTLLDLLIGVTCPRGGPDEGVTTPNQAGMVTMSHTTVVDLTQNLQPIPHSASTLIRNQHGASATLSTSGLNPDSAHTMWWLVFNNPAFCTAGDPELGNRCAEPDLFVEAVEASVFGGNGQVSDAYGRIQFSAHAFVGEETGGQTMLFGPGIIDPHKAEIHLIVQGHGPAQPLADAGLLEAALSNPGAGCGPDEPNEGICAGDVQVAVHRPLSE